MVYPQLAPADGNTRERSVLGPSRRLPGNRTGLPLRKRPGWAEIPQRPCSAASWSLQAPPVLTGSSTRCSRLFGEVGHYAPVRQPVSNAFRKQGVRPTAPTLGSTPTGLPQQRPGPPQGAGRPLRRRCRCSHRSLSRESSVNARPSERRPRLSPRIGEESLSFAPQRRCARSTMNAYSAAVSRKRVKRPEPPPWPAVMLTLKTSGCASSPAARLAARSLATHLAGS